MMKEITLDVGFNPSSISNKSLTSMVVIEQVNYTEKSRKSVEVYLT
jgi:hypothetical protein